MDDLDHDLLDYSNYFGRKVKDIFLLLDLI